MTQEGVVANVCVVALGKVLTNREVGPLQEANLRNGWRKLCEPIKTKVLKIALQHPCAHRHETVPQSLHGRPPLRFPAKSFSHAGGIESLLV
jgi:hypothetical protein